MKNSMKYSAKDFLRRRFINITVITIVSFIAGVVYLGFYKADVQPIEKVEEIEISVKS